MTEDRWWFSRRALALTLVSLTFWTIWNFARDQCHPGADLSCGVYTDHYSHMNLARMFTRSGMEIYRQPRSLLGEPLTDEQKAQLPSDLQQINDVVFYVPEWPPDKPYTVTWPQLPSFYPPGDMVLFAPASVIYRYTDISFSGINRLLIQLLLIYSHITIYLVLALAFRPSETRWLGVVGFLFVYNEIIHWTVEGFYDGGWIAPLILTPYLLARNRPLPALFTFSLAAVMHFRALFFVPWAVYAMFLIARDRDWLRWNWKDTAMASGTLICGGAAIGVLLIVMPALRSLGITNSLNFDAEAVNGNGLVLLAAITVIAGALFIRARAWLDFVLLVWICFMCVMLPEIRPWDSIALLPWMVAPISGPDRTWTRIAGEVRIAVVILLSIIVFHTQLTTAWIELALQRVL